MTEQSCEQDSKLVRIQFTADIDRKRLDEYLTANFKDEHVEIVDRETGDVLAANGEKPEPFICPVCGETALGITTQGGTKLYMHGGGHCEFDSEVDA
jgi:hypothetical protein